MPALDEGSREVVDLVATVDSSLRVAGAFNIVDAIQVAADSWVNATGVVPAPVVVRWESGGGEQEGTFFTPSTNEITLLGGTGNLQDTTDTDEFDDVIIGHEYAHFLVFNHSHSSSPGGSHGGEDLVPQLAFEEGFADWFGAHVTGRSLYLDTRGNEDGRASCALCDDLESSSLRRVEGIGSEQSIYEILWDLSDGAADQPADRDGDTIAISTAQLLGTLVAADPERDVHYIGAFLEDLVDAGVVALGGRTEYAGCARRS